MSNAMASNAAGTVDLRDWLKDVKQLEQLEQISGARWDLEIGALTEMTSKECLPPRRWFSTTFPVSIPSAGFLPTCSKP